MKRRIAASLQLGVLHVHVLADQVLDRVDRLVGKAQPLEHRGRHVGPDLLVAIEMRAFLRSGLADVVE